jgi:hypothetical protein
MQQHIVLGFFAGHRYVYPLSCAADHMCHATKQVAHASDGKRGIGDEHEKSAARYMAGVLLDERRWAFFYRRGRFTLGIASTQRCEGFFAKLKGALGRIGSLRHLTGVLASIMISDTLQSDMLINTLRERTSTTVEAELTKVRLVLSVPDTCCARLWASMNVRALARARAFEFAC